MIGKYWGRFEAGLCQTCVNPLSPDIAWPDSLLRVRGLSNWRGSDFSGGLRMTSLSIDNRYWTRTERLNLITLVGSPEIADGIVFNLMHAFIQAKELNEDIERSALEARVSPFFVDLAFEAKVLWYEDGVVKIILEKTLTGSPSVKKTRSKKVQVPADIVTLTAPDFETLLNQLFDIYPKRGGRNMGKKKGMEILLKKLKTEDEVQKFASAVESVRSQRADGRIKSDEFVPQWSTFANNWLEYLPENSADSSGPFKAF